MLDAQLTDSSEELMNKYFEKELHTDSIKLALESMHNDLKGYTKTGLLQNIVELNRPFPSYYCDFSKPNSKDISAFMRVEFDTYKSRKIIRWAFANSALIEKLKKEEKEEPVSPPPPPPFPPQKKE